MIPQRLQMLDDEAVERLHGRALALLAEMGIVFDDADACLAFAEAGASVDQETRLVRIPPDLLMSMVGRAPARFTMGGRESSHDCLMGGEVVQSRPVVGCLDITDATGACRPATVADATNVARLVDGLDEYTWNAAAVYPSDLPAASVDVAYCQLLLENTSKHFTISAFTPASLRYMVEMGAVVAGSEQALRERPLFNILVSTTCPMKYAAHQVGWIIAAGKAGIPASLASTPLMGATGPVTPAGCAILIHAENLAGVALAQLMSPGAPVYYSSRPTLMDMRSGNSIWGAIEMGMIDAATIQLARRCGLPADVLSLRTDSKVMDEQAALERMANTLMPALAGVSSIAGGGFLEMVRTVSLEQLAIDAEVLSMVRRAVAGLRVEDEYLATEVLMRVGHQGQFLAEPHTRRYHRSEFFQPVLADRDIRNAWKAKGARGMVERAGERAQEILRRHQPEPLAAEVTRELDSITAHAQREIV